MTTDRELLELAAKAAGIRLHVWGTPGSENYADMDKLPYGCLWNPLTDDGDALRLAVKCHIDIRHFMYECGSMDCLVDRIGRQFIEVLNDDPCAATRRAIVRAAAEIGKAMP